MGSKTRRNLSDDGSTTYHSDGSTSKTYKNVLDDGSTTYHSDGSTSKTYKNVLDDGSTTYHSDGSTSKTYKNVLDNGHTTYNSRNGSAATGNEPRISFDASDLGYCVLGIFVLGITVICAFTSLQFSFLPAIVIAVSFGGALLLSKKLGESSGFLIMQPFLLYGFHCWYHVAWTNFQRQGFLTGSLSILGIIVVEVLLELFILISKIADESEHRNGFLFFLIGCTALGSLFGALDSVFRIVYAVYSAFLLLVCLIVVLVRCSRPKGGQ